jgi:hypothetical protein
MNNLFLTLEEIINENRLIQKHLSKPEIKKFLDYLNSEACDYFYNNYSLVTSFGIIQNPFLEDEEDEVPYEELNFNDEHRNPGLFYEHIEKKAIEKFVHEEFERYLLIRNQLIIEKQEAESIRVLEELDFFQENVVSLQKVKNQKQEEEFQYQLDQRKNNTVFIVRLDNIDIDTFQGVSQYFNTFSEYFDLEADYQNNSIHFYHAKHLSKLSKNWISSKFKKYLSYVPQLHLQFEAIEDGYGRIICQKRESYSVLIENKNQDFTFFLKQIQKNNNVEVFELEKENSGKRKIGIYGLEYILEERPYFLEIWKKTLGQSLSHYSTDLNRKIDFSLNL